MDYTELLPDHILLDIFGNLTPKMLKSCTLVCKRWSEIIGNSQKFKESFRLNLEQKVSNIHVRPHEIQRKYDTIIVDQLIPAFEKIICGQNLHSLTISDTIDVLDCTALLKVLNMLPSLKVLHIPKYQIFPTKIINKLKMELEDLHCNARNLWLFDCKTIQILKLNFNYSNDEIRKIGIDFIKMQDNLEFLDVSDCVRHELFEGLTNDVVKFKLKTVIINKSCVFFQAGQLIEFLKLHKTSLKYLSLRKFHSTVEEYSQLYKFVLNNLSNLNHLGLETVYATGDDDLILNEITEDAKVYKNIESLSFHSISPNVDLYKRFLKMFTNLKHLNIGPYGLISALSTVLMQIGANIESLSIREWHEENEVKLLLPKLKKFSIKSIGRETDLCFFINRHMDTLEEFTIKDSEKLTGLTTYQLLQCDKLKLIDLNVTNINDQSIMASLQDIMLKAKPFIVKLRSMRLNAFMFPDDKLFWDERNVLFKKYNIVNEKAEKIKSDALFYC